MAPMHFGLFRLTDNINLRHQDEIRLKLKAKRDRLKLSHDETSL